MSSDVIVSAVGISKSYRVYRQPYHRLLQCFLFGKNKLYREVQALQECSFEVRRGECLGIIGRNGAGKSTVLQLLAGTLIPTSGELKINGRIAALLELGSGFNPEFTGRENIFMYGAILGLSPDRIRERYRSIVDFADIGDAVEQPVKTYSSGMAMRLAFAVVAHIDADVLIIDEALAVGDVVFVQKCYAFLRDFIREHQIQLCCFATPASGSMTVTPIPVKNGKAEFVDYATGQPLYEKTEEMTHIRGNLLVSKRHPRIAFRGKLDSLMARVMSVQIIAEETGDTGTLEGLDELLAYLQAMLAAEVKD